MKFKAGDKVKFKPFDKLDPEYKWGTAGEYHKRHENETAKVVWAKTKQSGQTKISIDIDTQRRFSFKAERFIKMNKLEVDDELFEM